MGLIEKIEELQKKPETERRKIFFITLALSMITVTLLWLSLLGHNLRIINETTDKDAPKPLGLVWESARGAAADLQKEMIEKMENISN